MCDTAIDEPGGVRGIRQNDELERAVLGEVRRCGSVATGCRCQSARLRFYRPQIEATGDHKQVRGHALGQRHGSGRQCDRRRDGIMVRHADGDRAAHGVAEEDRLARIDRRRFG